jgi:peptidoglycan/xylan/chitin deacetylase (PgdA/CDA1 family)
MIALALVLGFQMSARLIGLPGVRHAAGVDLKQELRSIRPEKGEQLKLISQTYTPKTIALTFDDGPHAGKTDKLLKILKDLDVKATFFLVGKMVDRNPQLVRDELAGGHEIGNHTYDHLNLEKLTSAQVAFEYQACSDAIQRAAGIRPQFCRPPGGRFDTEILKAASDEGMWTVLWTDDPGDFARPDPKVLVDRLDKQMHDGGILLLHDGIPQTLEVLPAVITELKHRGYRFVTCSELLAQKRQPIVTYAKHAPAATTVAFRRKPSAGGPSLVHKPKLGSR